MELIRRMTNAMGRRVSFTPAPHNKLYLLNPLAPQHPRGPTVLTAYPAYREATITPRNTASSYWSLMAEWVIIVR